MKVWESILLGASMRDQAKGHFWCEACSCAMGASAEAIGLYPSSIPFASFSVEILPEMVKKWPYLNSMISYVRPGSSAGPENHPFHTIISMLNFYMTREQVAEVIRPIEEALLAEQEKKAAVKEGAEVAG